MTRNTQAALFSAIITAFLVTALSDLGPNYQHQSALLLYQSLNGRDPNLASMSDPTAPFQPSGSAIAVNFLWSASLSASLGASFIAVICKEWLAEYNSCTNVAVDLLQACWRQHRFLILRKLKIHFIISLLPPLLHSSVLFFFAGAVIYFWQINVRVAIVYLVAGGTFCIAYLISTFLPIVMRAPFRPSSAELVRRSSVAIGKVTKPIVGTFARGCSLTLRNVIGVVPWQITRTVFAVNAALGTFYQQTRTILSRGSKHTRDWWADVSNDSLDEIDTSQRAQEEAILWLSQMPLDPSESEDVVSSLALISRPHKFPKSMIVFVCFALDSWIHEAPDRRQADPAINCVILLGHIKYQSVVDRNSDQDHNVGGIPVTTSVAWAAQQLATGGFDKGFNTPYPEEIRARLLAAAAWLSPEFATEEVTPEGKKLEIQDRSEFLKEIGEILTQRIRSSGSFDNRALINLIRGMHACIPRENYGSPASIIPFLQLFCEGYGSPWSGDESALSALITYALDLLLPSGRRRPLVEREIEFSELASELIDVLKADVTAIDVVMFGFWLIYCAPYAFRSRKSLFADIVHIRTSTIPEDNGEVSDDRRRISEDHRKRVDFLAVGAFVAAAQCHVAANDTLPKLAVHNTLNLLRAAPEDGYGRLMATYGVAMILNLSSSSQAATFAGEVDAGLYTNALCVVRDDLERNTAEENVLNLHIYSALVLLKLPQPQADIEGVRTLIREMQNAINGPVVRDSGLARDSATETSADPDRVKWKAIYLFGLLFRLLPPGEWEGDIGVLRNSVRTLVLSREFPLADDYEHCIGPLGMDASHLGHLDERQWLGRSAFEGWIHKFPLFPLAGSKIRGERWIICVWAFEVSDPSTSRLCYFELTLDSPWK